MEKLANLSAKPFLVEISCGINLMKFFAAENTPSPERNPNLRFTSSGGKPTCSPIL